MHYCITSCAHAVNFKELTSGHVTEGRIDLKLQRAIDLRTQCRAREDVAVTLYCRPTDECPCSWWKI